MTTPSKCLICLIAAASLAAPAPADTTVGGMITTDTHWTLAGSPYVAGQSVLVTDDATLTIDPGVEVRFAPQTALAVTRGQLIARGTAGEPIRFTRDGPDEADRWGYIGFGDESVDASFDTAGAYLSGCILEHAIVEYAGGTDLVGAIRADHAVPLIKDSTIQHNSKCGIHGTYAGGLRLIGNQITGNHNDADGRGGGVYMYRSEDVLLAGNTISGNQADEGGGVLLKEGCYDGTLLGNEISGNIANTGGGVCLRDFSNRVSLSENDIHGNTAAAGAGVRIYWCDDISMAGDRVVDNVGDGILCTAGTETCQGLILSQHPHDPTRIHGNQGYQVYNALEFSASAEPAGPGNVDARNVWWATMDTAEIEAGIHDFFDDAALGIVYFAPFALGGDANGDGVVDGADYTLWADHYGQTGRWNDGDFTGDGLVDGSDYTLWADNYCPASGAAPLPAPSVAAMLAVAAMAVLKRRP